MRRIETLIAANAITPAKTVQPAPGPSSSTALSDEIVARLESTSTTWPSSSDEGGLARAPVSAVHAVEPAEEALDDPQPRTEHEVEPECGHARRGEQHCEPVERHVRAREAVVKRLRRRPERGGDEAERDEQERAADRVSFALAGSSAGREACLTSFSRRYVSLMETSTRRDVSST